MSFLQHGVMALMFITPLTTERLFLGYNVLTSLQGHRPVRHAESEGGAEWDGEPGQSASEQTTDAMRRLCCDTALPERLVDKHRAKAACKTETETRE